MNSNYKTTIVLFPLLILCLAGLVSSCTSGTIRRATNLAKDAGLDGAGENCNNGKCEDDLLQCNLVSDTVTNGIEKQCQVKAWLVGLMTSIVVFIPLLLMSCCLFLCFKYHCFSRLLWWYAERKTTV